MISVCIPIYNQDVSELVKALQAQLELADIPYEICLQDDGSTVQNSTPNQSLANGTTVLYNAFDRNKGRSAARNALIKTAQYPNLLFLDNDVQIHHQEFINRYLSELEKGKEIIYGGREYPKTAPSKSQYLRWKYGKTKEGNKPKKGKINPLTRFASSNFMVKRTIAKKYHFNKQLKGYGYEDTLWIKQVLVAGHTLTLLDNPVFVAEIDTTKEFLNKTDQAIKNLAFLYKKDLLVSTDGINLIGAFERMKLRRRFWLFNLIYKFVSAVSGKVENMRSLTRFSMYKLKRFQQELEKNK